MNKTELVETVAGRLGLTKKLTDLVINAAVEEMTAGLVRGESVKIAGLGAFEVRELPAREGMNPKTRQPVRVAASRRATFRPAKPLKDALNQ